MVDEVPVDPERLEVALAALLDRYPGAPVAGVNEHGIFVPLPLSFDVGEHGVVEGRSAIDLVVPADRVVVIAGWERARAVGAARASVHLHGRPHQPVTLNIFDVRRAYGMFVVVFVEDEGAGEALVEVPAAPPIAPRAAIQRKNEVAVFLDVDDATSQILGVSREEIIGGASLDFVHPDDQQRSIVAWIDLLDAPGATRRVRLRHRRGDGSWIWLELTNHNLLAHPEFGCVITEMVDISDEIAAQEAVRAREELLRRLTETIPLGVLQVDHSGTVVYTNERLHQILGREAVATIEEQLDTVVTADRAVLGQAIDAVLRDGSDCDLEVRVGGRREDDGLRLCRVGIRALRDTDGAATIGAVLCVDDVTESARLRSELEDRATFDVLTRCLNRAAVMSVLDETLAESKSGAIFVDLDRFKQVNDVLGHAAGDDLLVAAAERLRQAVRGSDVVGRLGGDEFLVVCPGVDSPAEVVAIADRIVRAFEPPVEIPGAGRVGVRASVGVALSGDGDDADTLVANADVAMYESKRQGSADPVVYAPRLRIGLAGGLEDERSLRDALEAGELCVHYQPVFDLVSGRVTAYEALLRWQRDGDLLPAGRFVGLAEQAGLIHEIGQRVLDEVCAQAALMSGRGDAARHWSVNVSPRQLAAAGFVARVRDALDRHRLPADRLMVELTEPSTLGDGFETWATLCELLEVGVALALDDFGLGWPLDSLRTIPVRAIKTERSFTAALTSDSASRHVVEAMIGLGERLGVQVVAKGVESDEQRDAFRALGGRLAQGHLFAAARPPEELFGARAGRRRDYVPA